MDNASLFIGLSLLAIFILPVIYILIVQHNKENQYRKIMRKIADENQLNLNKTEFYYPVGLGLDSHAKKFLIVDLKQIEDYDIIDLKQAKKIRLSVNHSPTVYDSKLREKIVHLSLCIESSTKTTIKEITLYDEEDENSTDADIRLNEATKWDNLLQKTLAL